jgi:hydrogenase maturation factor
MRFETVVLKKVEDIIGIDHTASFTGGTLFVACTEDQARKVFHRLSKDMFGKVKVSKSEKSPEYAFDFVV